MPHSSWGSVSLFDLTFHMRSKPRRSSLVAWVAVVEAAFAVGAVHRGKSATSVPVSSVLAGLQPWVGDLVPPSPAVVTVLPCLISSEPAVPRSKLHAGASLLTDAGNLIVTVCVADCICRIYRIRHQLTYPANRRVGVTFPDAASVNYVSDRGLRRDAVQVPAQVTITMAGYKSIPNQSELGCLSHVSKSLDR